MERKVSLVAKSRTGDPISALHADGNMLYTGSIAGCVTGWDLRMLPAAGEIPRPAIQFSEWKEEGIRGLTTAHDRLHATVGDHFISSWLASDASDHRRGDLQRPHNATVCSLSYPIQHRHRVLVVTQGQAHSHLADIASGRQQCLTTLGCPWYCVPCDLVDDRLLWRELLNGGDSCLARGKTGDLQRLRVWSIETPSSAHSLATICVKSNGGFRLWGPRLVSAFHGSTVALYNLDDGARVATLEGHSKHLMGIDFRADEIVTVAADRTVKLWRDHKCFETISLPAHAYRTYAPDMTKVAANEGGEGDERRIFVSTGDAIYMINT